MVMIAFDRAERKMGEDTPLEALGNRGWLVRSTVRDAWRHEQGCQSVKH